MRNKVGNSLQIQSQLQSTSLQMAKLWCYGDMKDRFFILLVVAAEIISWIVIGAFISLFMIALISTKILAPIILFIVFLAIGITIYSKIVLSRYQTNNKK